jgi:hypothetical protein
MIHNLCVCLDKYFGSVCELDLVFNIERVSLAPTNSIPAYD